MSCAADESAENTLLVRDSVEGPVERARELGTRLAEQLLRRGGEAILNEIYGRA